jgi:hypothetical protein
MGVVARWCAAACAAAVAQADYPTVPPSFWPAAPPAPRVAPRAGAPRPHIVLHLTDDQGWANVGYHNKGHVITPTMDRLAAEGIRFERHYGYQWCAPSRASLMVRGAPSTLYSVHCALCPQALRHPVHAVLSDGAPARPRPTGSRIQWPPAAGGGRRERGETASHGGDPRNDDAAEEAPGRGVYYAHDRWVAPAPSSVRCHAEAATTLTSSKQYFEVVVATDYSGALAMVPCLAPMQGSGI